MARCGLVSARSTLRDRKIRNKRDPCYIFQIARIHKGNLLWTKPQPCGRTSRTSIQKVLIPHPAGLRPKLLWCLGGEVDHTLSRPDDCVRIKVRAKDTSNNQTARMTNKDLLMDGTYSNIFIMKGNLKHIKG